MNCPNCGTYNETSNRYCLKCGFALAAESAQATTPKPSATAPQSPPPASWSAPTQPTYTPPYHAPTPYQQPGYYPPPMATPSTNILNIWGPFAGYGARRRHVGWLMDGEGHRAADLLATVEAKFKEREVPGAYLYRTSVTARGVMVETRPYFILRRGLASLALYIAQFGHDLFISQASYLKPPISNFRLLVAVGMLMFQGYMSLIYPAAVSAALNDFSSSFSLFGGGSSDAMGGLATLLCIVGPLGGLNALALFALFCFSAYKWLTERDFWAALRVPPNEFNEDDLMAMEKAVEETVRQSLTDLKLNPDDLKRASAGRGGGQLF